MYIQHFLFQNITNKNCAYKWMVFQNKSTVNLSDHIGFEEVLARFRGPLTLSLKLRDGFAIVLGAFILFCSELLVGHFHSLYWKKETIQLYFPLILWLKNITITIKFGHVREIKSVLENRITKPDHRCQTDFICGRIHVKVYMTSHYKVWFCNDKAFWKC